MAIVDISVIEKFESMTKFGLAKLLLDFSVFMNRHRSRVIDYYAGTVRTAHEPSFRELGNLIKDFSRLNDVIENSKTRLTHTLYWELIETISDINIVLHTIDNSSRWLRSAIAKNDFSPGIEVDHTLKMLQTLESVSRTIQGASNPQNEWVSIALRNDLVEEGYNSKGGNVLKLGYRNRATVQIRTVIDTINGESVYGRDVYRKITFGEDEDLLVLGEKETVYQSVFILSSLKQGDTPEFRGEGVQAGLVVGANRGSIAYPILSRQLFSTFQKDDSLKSFRVNNITNKDDSISLELQVETRLSEIITVET